MSSAQVRIGAFKPDSAPAALRQVSEPRDTLGRMENWWVNAIWSVTPTVLIGIFFALILRFILRADRTERRIYKEMEAEERAKLGLPPKSDN